MESRILATDTLLSYKDTHHMDLSTVRRAAKAGDAEAQHTLGQEDDLGVYVRRNFARAAASYPKAAAQGHAQAQTQLGHIYRLGYGVPTDFAEAYGPVPQSSRARARRGAVAARRMVLRKDRADRKTSRKRWFGTVKPPSKGTRTRSSVSARCTNRGRGVPQDLSRARKWWEEARASETRERGEMESLIDCGQSLVRDPVVIRALKKEYPADWTRRVDVSAKAVHSLTTNSCFRRPDSERGSR